MPSFLSRLFGAGAPPRAPASEVKASRADALIAMLEQQANYINTMFEAMRIASETYR